MPRAGITRVWQRGPHDKGSLRFSRFTLGQGAGLQTHVRDYVPPSAVTIVSVL